MKKLLFLLLMVTGASAFAQVQLTSTGSANAYLLTFPGVFSYSPGISVTFKSNFANTGAATINVNSLGAKDIKKEASNALAANDIKSGQVVTLVYDGTNFQMTSASGNTAGGGGGGSQTLSISNDTLSISGGNSVVLPGGASSGWNTTGNAGTNPATNFIGTTDAQPVMFRANDTLRMQLRTDGVIELYNNNINTGIGEAVLANSTGAENTAVGSYALNANTTGSGNSAVGIESLTANTEGSGNVGVGAFTLISNTTGNANTALGLNAMLLNTGGSSNVAIGNEALHANTNTSNLVAIGDSALYNNTDGVDNTSVGSKTLFTNTNGGLNSAFGSNALYSNTEGSGNSSFGAHSLYNNTEGSYNTVIGYGSLLSNTIGSNNVAIGAEVLMNNNDQNSNTAIGYNSQRNSTGNSNVTLGMNTLIDNTGDNNTAIGTDALQSPGAAFNVTAIGAGATTGASNLTNATAIGSAARVDTSNAMVLGDTTINVGFGIYKPLAKVDIDARNDGNYSGFRMRDGSQGAGKVLTSNANGFARWETSAAASSWNLTGNAATDSTINFVGTTDNKPIMFRTNNTVKMILRRNGNLDLYNTNNNVAIGALAMQNLGGNNSTAVGNSALSSATTNAHNNTAFGKQALNSTNNGTDNTAVGYLALSSNTTGNNNVAVGVGTMTNSSFTRENVGVGNYALLSNTGFNNTAIGDRTLRSNVGGHYNTGLGDSANVGVADLTFATAIGAKSFVESSYSLVLGAVSGKNDYAGPNTKVGIGTTAPAYALHVKGKVEIDTMDLSTASTDSVVMVGTDGVLRKRASADVGSGGGGGTLAGDVTGAIGTNTVEKIRGVNVVATPPTTNQVLQYNGTNWAPATLGGGGGNPAWELNGNAGTDSSANFIGTTDDQPLIFKAGALGFGMKLTMDGALEFANTSGSSIFIGKGTPASESFTRTIVIGDDAMRTVDLNDDSRDHTVIGYGALYNFYGSYRDGNTVVGSKAAYNLIYGANNTIIGRDAMDQTESGDGNVALGEATLRYNNGGNFNTAVGYGATVGNTDLSNATAIGANAVVAQSNSLVLGDTSNIKVGIRTGFPKQALHVNGQVRIDTTLHATDEDSILTITSGGVIRKRTAASLASGGGGGGTLAGDVTGDISSNTVERIRGYNVINIPPSLDQVLQFNGVSWAPTTLISGGAGWALTGNATIGSHFLGTTNADDLRFKTGNNNYMTLTKNGVLWLNQFDGTANNNVFIGDSVAVTAVASGGSNFWNNTVAIGSKALKNGSSQQYSDGTVAIGYGALENFVTDGPSNVAVGYLAMNELSSAYGNNTALGTFALKKTQTSGNTGIGHGALQENTDGVFNTALGAYACANCVNGSQNIAIGHESLFSNASGGSNIAIGKSSLTNNGTGSDNVVIGSYAGYTNANGNFNVAIGFCSPLLSIRSAKNHCHWRQRHVQRWWWRAKHRSRF
jgi:hypothetical protein